MTFKDFPSHVVRESSRARHVRLTISLKSGLVVTVPQGFDRSLLPGILEKKQCWIRNAFERINRNAVCERYEQALPESLTLEAISRTWRVCYSEDGENGSVRLVQEGPSILHITGHISNTRLCGAILVEWLKAQGRLHLVPWLHALSRETGLQVRNVQIRAQKSRWGSCSSTGTISLNSKLLLLSPQLVRYILIHELCHTVHPNHSSRFWTLVEKWEPGFRHLDAEVNRMSRKMPLWAG